MTKREPLQTEEFFKKRLSDLDRAIEERNASLQQRSSEPDIGLYANFQDRYEQVLLAYSVGESVPALAARFPIVIDSYEAYVQCPSHTPIDLRDLDGYIMSMCLVSFALIFKVDDASWSRLVACIGNEGKDALHEALVATRTPDRAASRDLLHPTIFEPLLKAVSATGESRNALIKRYLKGWYRGREKTRCHNLHKRDDGGFYGYWAVEVAGVVRAFDMDDTSFEDMAFYPRDLVA